MSDGYWTASNSGKGRWIAREPEPAAAEITRTVELGPLFADVRADGSVTLRSGGGYRLRDFTTAEWMAFYRGVKDGEFDDLASTSDAS